ncbi:VWA domain-containing protein [Candidatus Thorarchaeota archaeon]|nr:MAG: VWA domain-containing protein [Candidatus Thorarchaeota archaeon]
MAVMELVEFSQRFAELARNCAHEYAGINESIFSSRQSIAIASLGTARILRTAAQLEIKDLVTLAVTTSPPNAKGYAEMIALRLLVGDEAEWFSDVKPATTKVKNEQQETKPQITGSTLLLQHVLDFLDFQSSVDTKKMKSQIDFMKQLESEIFADPGEREQKMSDSEKLDYARKRTAFELANGREGILDRGIDSWEGLFDRAHQNILQSVPSIDRTTLAQTQLMDQAAEVQNLAREPFVKSMTELLQQTALEQSTTQSDRREEILEDMSATELSKALGVMKDYKSLLQRMGVSEVSYAPSVSDIIKDIEEKVRTSASTLDDLQHHPELYQDNLERQQMSEILEKSFNPSNPLESLDKAKEVDDLLNTNFSERMYDSFKQEFESVSAEEHIANPINTPEWLDSFDNAMERFNQQASVQDRQKLVESIEDVLESYSASSLIESKLEAMQKEQVSQMIHDSASPDELTESVEFARDTQISFSVSDVRTKGEELGMSKEEIGQLIGDVFEYLKDIIETEDPSFERTSAILERAHLTDGEKRELIQEAVKHKAAGALGAFAEQDLEQVVSQVPNTAEGEELLESALGAGPGENLLNQWFKGATNLPPWARAIVKRAAKQIMIEIAKAKAASLIGSSEAGPIPEGSARPYIIGDDPDTIDLDETIDNIIMQGKLPSQVEVGDFIVRNPISGRRCVVFLVDVSGSMSGAPLASASLATAMLLFAFAKDELGIALFESNSHILCEVGEPRDIDEIVDQVLDLRAMGGTQMQAALEWAEEQFEISKSTDRMFVLLTDAMIYDFQNCENTLRSIADMGVTSVLIMPGSTYGMGNIQDIIESANAHLVVVKRWEDFPDIVSKVLSRS